MTKFIQVLVIVLLVVFTITLSKDIYLQIRKFSDIAKLESEVSLLAQKNDQLKKRLKESADPLSLEKEARDKLGYQKPGEVLYVTDLKKSKSEKSDRLPVWRQWLELLSE